MTKQEDRSQKTECQQAASRFVQQATSDRVPSWMEGGFQAALGFSQAPNNAGLKSHAGSSPPSVIKHQAHARDPCLGLLQFGDIQWLNGES